MMLLALFVSNVFAMVFGKYSVFHNQTVELQYNQMAFFETPEFPLLHNSTKFFKYNVTFTTTDSSINGTRCVMILQGLSFKPTPYKDINAVYVFEVSSFHLESYQYVLQFYDAFSGYLYFEKIDEFCPFEKMSRDTPYNFTDENEIIFISSVYKNSTNFIGSSVTPIRTHACKWQFIAPDGYGLKIFVQDFNISSSTSFRISNTTDLLLTERSAKINHPYYYYDINQHFEITLSKDNNSFAGEVEFSAFLSVVKQNVKKIDGNCVLSKSESNYTWSSANLTQGYGNDINCVYEVVVKNGSSVLGFVTQLSAEPFVDNLIYFDDQYTYLLELHFQFLLEPYSNGSSKVYIFQFVTDGSVQASGFMINFTENPCLCNDAEMVCDNGTYTVMKDSSFICPNIECNFVLQPCHTPFSSLFITLTNYTDYDFIKVFSNDIVIYDSALLSRNLSGSVNLYLKSENNNTMITSSISRRRKSTSFYLSSFELPQVEEHIILKENGFSYVLDASVTSFAVIEIEEAMAAQNVSIIVYGRNDLACKNVFFTNESLSELTVFDSCTESNSFYKCRSKVKKMVFFHSVIIVNCFIGFSLSVHPKECYFPSNVYFVEGDKSVVSVMSTLHGQCLATIIKEFDKSYILSNVFTTSKDENVEIWFGENQGTKFLEYNEKTSSKFINVLAMSEIYAVRVPKGAAAQLTFVSTKLPFQQHIGNFPFYSLIASPHYGLKKCFTYDSQSFISYEINNVLTKFTILEFHPNDESYFLANNERFRINGTGDVFLFRNQTVSLFFKTTEQTYCGIFLLVQKIELKEDNGFLIK